MAWKKSRGAHRAALKPARTFQARSGWLGEHDGCGRYWLLSPTQRARLACRRQTYAAAIRIGPAISR